MPAVREASLYGPLQGIEAKRRSLAVGYKEMLRLYKKSRKIMLQRMKSFVSCYESRNFF